MKLLAIETATEACSAALYIDGEIGLRYQVKPRGHSELILGMMEALLAEAELAAPVNWTPWPSGVVRVRLPGCGSPPGWCRGRLSAPDLPVVPVSTLAALAQRAFREHGERRLLPAYDARMQELYWAAYRGR